MKRLLAVATIGSLAFAAPSAFAIGCASGAAAGGVAGHVAGHHGLLGAAAGCAVGHHENAKHKAAAQTQQTQPAPSQGATSQ